MMKAILAALLILSPTILAQPEEILAATDVCFTANTFTTGYQFSPPDSGEISGIKLVWKSGLVNCYGAASNHWGCTGTHGMAVQMIREDGTAQTYYPTDTTNNIISTTHYNCAAGCKYRWYNMDYYDIYSNEVTLIDDANTYEVTTDMDFSLQYGEGCCSDSTGDNSGTACADVYFIYDSVVDEGPQDFLVQSVGNRDFCMATDGCATGSLITIEKCDFSATKQRWDVINIPNAANEDIFRFQSEGCFLDTGTKFCVDVPDTDYNNNVKLILWTCNTGGHQQFLYDDVGTLGDRGMLKAVGSLATNEKCFDVGGDGYVSGNQLQIYTCHGGDNQLFDDLKPVNGFKLMGTGSCWNAANQHPTHKTLSEVDNKPETCAAACIREYGDQCGGFDTRGTCLIYQRTIVKVKNCEGNGGLSGCDTWTDGVCYAIDDLNPALTMNVEMTMKCDNHLAVFYSNDNFETYVKELSPLDPLTNLVTDNAYDHTISFEAPMDATIRIGCWDYGGGRYLGGTITVDGKQYTMANNFRDFELLGFEETCPPDENTYCTSNYALCHPDIPATLLNPTTVLADNGGDVLAVNGGAGYFWPQAEKAKCGIFWIDFTPYVVLSDESEPEPVLECPVGDADTFDWDQLTENGIDIPVVTFTMDVEPDDLSLNIEVTVDYIVRASADDEGPLWGTTYVLDFEDFDSHKSSITEPNTCSNRLEDDYTRDGVALTDDERFEIRSDEFNAIGTTENMCYPPAGGVSTGWEIVKHSPACDKIVYKGKWTWGELRGCRNHINAITEGGGRQTFIDDTDEQFLQLKGTFYVNMVSPFWHEHNDAYRNYYRVYQLVSQPFVIRVSRSVYVIGSTDINVMTMSIIAVYKEDQDEDYTLILLTETAEYLQLENPDLIEKPDGTGQFSLEMATSAETGQDCLNNKAYLCSQLWKVFADGTQCSSNRDAEDPNGGIDFSGTYRIRFDPLCRTGTVDANGYNFNTHCNTWLEDHSQFNIDNNGVQLESNLVFVDEICETREFTVQLKATMTFYEEPEPENDPEFQTQISEANGNLNYLYQVGESTVYGEIILDFPLDTDTIFGSTLVNVWVCTFPPDSNVADHPPSQNGPSPLGPNGEVTNSDNGGCFSDKRDGFGNADTRFFFHIYSSQQNPILKAEEFEVIENGDTFSNRIRYEFRVPHEIQRDTLYVHAQVEVTLQAETGRRRILLDVSHGAITTKMAHFGKNIGITNNPYNNPEPETPPQSPQFPQQPIQQPPATQPFTISLNSSWVIIIGALLSMVLAFNIILMCYMNCCRGRNGTRRVSFNKNRRSGYDSVKHIDSEQFDDSEANLIDVN